MLRKWQAHGERVGRKDTFRGRTGESQGKRANKEGGAGHTWDSRVGEWARVVHTIAKAQGQCIWKGTGTTTEESEATDQVETAITTEPCVIKKNKIQIWTQHGPIDQEVWSE